MLPILLLQQHIIAILILFFKSTGIIIFAQINEIIDDVASLLLIWLIEVIGQVVTWIGTILIWLILVMGLLD